MDGLSNPLQCPLFFALVFLLNLSIYLSSNFFLIEGKIYHISFVLAGVFFFSFDILVYGLTNLHLGSSAFLSLLLFGHYDLIFS